MGPIASEVADLFVILNSVTEPFKRGLKDAASEAESQSKRMNAALGTVVKAGLGIGAVAVGAGVASVKMAGDFQATMETIHTQAGVAQNQIAGLSSGVLNLAGQVGFAPNSLAEALYHIESSFASVGITGPKALNLLQIAAEGAAVGHADLVDVTNALDAAIASGIPGVQDFQQAMGVLNAVVGSGDMTMQDLANAFSTGALANVKSYGASITDVGAALAVFGDNNIRGQNAATDLRMSMQALQTPAATASVLLAKMGMDAHTLGDTMSKGGLLPALELLHQKMTALGYTEQTQGAALTELFGKKAGAGIVVLYDQLDRLKSKYPDQIDGAKNFADAWVQTKATVSQQVKEIGAGMDALGVRLGMYLIPQVSRLITDLQSAGGQVVSGFTGAATKPLAHDNMRNALLNRDLATPPPLTGWQQFGEEVHRVLTDVEDGAKKLEPIGEDFLRFGGDVWQSLQKIEPVALGVAHDLGVGLYLGAEAAGKVFANILGPAIKDVADFIGSHQTMIRIFADVILGGLALKMGVLGTINATKGLIDLATKIVQFPVGQVGEITTAWKGMTAAWTGKEAAEGEQAVQGLAGAFGDLKSKASGVLDKILPDSGKLAGIAKMGQDFEQSGLKAKGAVDQLSLFATTEQGIVQLAPHEQLSLFEQDLSNVEMEAPKAAAATEGLAGKIGKFALAGGVAGAAVFGLVELGQWVGRLGGASDHTTQSVDDLNQALKLAGMGSAQASSDFTQSAAKVAALRNIWGASMEDVLAGSTQQLKDADAALAQLATSGHADQAKAQFTDIANALAKQGIDAAAAAADFPQYEKAIKGAGDAAQTTDGQLSSMQATLNMQQGLTAFTSDLATMTDQLKTSGNSMDASTQAGQQNQRMFESLAGDVLNYYQQQRTAGIDTGTATNVMGQQAQQIEKLGAQFGISKDVVDQFLGSLAGIKPLYSTTVTANIGPAEQALNGLVQQINNSTGTVQIYGSSVGPGTGGRALGGMADGGFVPGPKNAPMLMIVHGGEYVVSNDMQAGRQSIDPRVLSGLGLGSRAVGYVPGVGSGAAGVVNNYYVMNVAGTVLSQMELENLVRTQVLRTKSRNSVNLLG